MRKNEGVIKRYFSFLPVTLRTPVVSLNEGDTPLIKSAVLSERVGGEVYLKCEGLNPTGSFKDRGMTVAISKAKEAGARAVVCASTGNTSASAAAYAARAGLKCVVLVPEGAVALGKLSQALIHGAKVLVIRGGFDVALSLVRELSRQHQLTLVNSVNPFRLEGQKTAAFEICDALEGPPDFQTMPVGNAGNITAYWQGYKEYRERGLINRLPRLLGFQAKGAAPIVLGRIVKKPKTIATAIRIGNPASWQKAKAARDESKGLIEAVSDAEIVSAYQLLARSEGVFVEPASAASVAGLLKLARRGYFKKEAPRRSFKVVCILTGHGLKDPSSAIRWVPKPKTLPPRLDRIIKEI